RTTGRQQPDSQPGWTEARRVLRILSVVLGVLAALWLVYHLITILVLVVFSILFAYLIAPLVAVVRRRSGLSAGLAIGLVYLAIFSVLVMSLSWLTPQWTEQVARLAKEAPPRLQSADASASLGRLLGRLQLPGLSGPVIDRAMSTAMSALETGGREVVSAFV